MTLVLVLVGGFNTGNMYVNSPESFREWPHRPLRVALCDNRCMGLVPQSGLYLVHFVHAGGVQYVGEVTRHDNAR